MTHQQRTIVRAALNDAKRAWLQAQGGYELVERDANAMDHRIHGTKRGNRYPVEKHEQARKLRDAGMTLAAIGRELGVHHSTVFFWLDPDTQTRKLETQRNRRSRVRSRSTDPISSTA